MSQLYRELRERNEEIAKVNASAQRMVDPMKLLNEASPTMTEEIERAAVGAPPKGRGLLGAVVEGKRAGHAL